jgi:tetratricopeptide (TPR) repeat protein
MKTKAASGARLSDTILRFVRRGQLSEAASAAARDAGVSRRIPVDLYDIYFPQDDGRQDLVNWIEIRRRLLAPYRRSLLAVRARVRRRLGRCVEPEAAAVIAYFDLLLEDFEAAAVVLDRATGSDPAPTPAIDFLHALSLWLLSARARSRESMPRALFLIDRSIRRDCENVYAYYIRAGLRRELEDVSGRLADAEKILQLRPHFVWAAVEKAETLAETRRFSEALDILNDLLRRYPRSAWAWAQRGRLFGLYGRRLEAATDFDRAVRCDRHCGPLYAWRGELLRRGGDFKGALAQFSRSIRLDPSYRLGFQWRGRVSLLLGRYQSALADLKRALALEPREDLARAWMAEAYWKMGRCREATRLFDMLHPAEPRATWNRVLSEGQAQELRYDLGALPDADRRDVEFWRDLDEVVSKRPRDAWARAFRGRCRVSDGRLPEALEDLTRALLLDRSLAYAYRWRAECLRRLGAPLRAEIDLDRCLEIAPDDHWAAAHRGLLRSARGDASAALRDFDRSLVRDDFRFAVIHLWRSQCLKGAGREAEAVAAADKSFVLDGKQPEIVSWRARLLSDLAAATPVPT